MGEGAGRAPKAVGARPARYSRGHGAHAEDSVTQLAAVPGPREQIWRDGSKPEQQPHPHPPPQVRERGQRASVPQRPRPGPGVRAAAPTQRTGPGLKLLWPNGREPAGSTDTILTISLKTVLFFAGEKAE